MADEGHRLTDEQLAALERRIARVYGEAAREVQDEVTAYFQSFAKRDAEQRQRLEAGEITEQQYKQWRLAQMGRGRRFAALRDKLAERMTKANETAAAYVNDATPGIYSLNRNYAAYTIEQVAGDVGFTLWDEQTARRLLTEQPDLMPYYPPARAIKRGIDLAYGKRQITAQVTSGILMGEGIGKLADRLQRHIPEMNRTSAIRAARTAVTGAECAGRQDTYLAAEKMGLGLKKRWLATLDNRTRHAHALLDGQTVAPGKPFHVDGYELMFPGDKSAPGYLVYNCRCTVVADLDGVDTSDAKRRTRDPVTGESVLLENMTYPEWEKWVQKRRFGDIIGQETSNGITITGVSEHSFERSAERQVEPGDVVDAIKNPLNVRGVVYDAKGRPSQRFTGRQATVNVNPSTGVITTVWKTGNSTRKKYGKGNN